MLHNLLELQGPGQKALQKGIGRGLAQISAPIQKKAQIIEGLQTVGLRCLHHRVDDGTGFRTLRRIAEQPVLP